MLNRWCSGGEYMDIQIMLVLIVLTAAIVLFVTETLRADAIAIIIMLTAGWHPVVLLKDLWL